ncbi:hypothetical protein ACFOOM_18735 [Streptomyces echinoruber]|uniref:Uncharacterized protein n=1 Tax=Streptomyces echinoruber TaxID=68898 RepID=A0A918VC26_9ACTN|nr:hypothetical protein [Streptomyces echinoruber]GGZ88337.1 hypothetical protein GCM10010389_28280 [Streptomyces echinoruber]
MVRRSQTSNPRSVVVLTSGADWRGRVASQQRSGGGDFPLPRQQAAKVQALQRTIQALRIVINAKRRAEARYLFSRARALVEALPASQTAQERRQLSELRRKFTASGKALAQNNKKTRSKPVPKAGPVVKSTVASRPIPVPKPTPVPKPDLAPKPPRKPKRKPGRKAKRSPFPEFGDRYINRAALGYAPVDETRSPEKR